MMCSPRSTPFNEIFSVQRVVPFGLIFSSSVDETTYSSSSALSARAALSRRHCVASEKNLIATLAGFDTATLYSFDDVDGFLLATTAQLLNIECYTGTSL